MPYAHANGIRIYYEEYGQGKPLLPLHGATETFPVMWRPHLPSFSECFRVIAPDGRGHGGTDNPEGVLSYQLRASDMAAFACALDLEKPLVCGYSDGGQIALEMGMRYPELPRAIVVGAAWYRMSETYTAAILALGLEGPGVVNFEQVQTAVPQIVDLLQAMPTRAGDANYWRTLLRQWSAMWWTPLDYTAEDFQKITAPTLPLIGDRDGMIDLDQAVEMYRAIPHAELAVLPNATHVIPFSVLEPFMTIVLDFLRRHSQQAPMAGDDA